MKTTWEKAQQFETSWWGNCTSTYAEETKQLLYAEKMGLDAAYVEGKYPVYNLSGKSILDIGGGPMSILLSCTNFALSGVVDPGVYPDWVKARYEQNGISFVNIKGEDIPENARFDEVWIYNTLQHVDSPEKVIENARRVGKLIRLFEWVEIPTNVGHPHFLTNNSLSSWLGRFGAQEYLQERECYGMSFYGVFDYAE